MNRAAGLSCAILATSARRTTGLVAAVSRTSVNRVSPYAISTSGIGNCESGTLKVVATDGAQNAIVDTNKAMDAVRTGPCYLTLRAP